MVWGVGVGAMRSEKPNITPYVTKNSLDIKRDLEYNTFILILCKMIGYLEEIF